MNDKKYFYLTGLDYIELLSLYKNCINKYELNIIERPMKISNFILNIDFC